MNRFPLHHIGIVMTSFEHADRFCKKFGLEPDYSGYVEIYHSDCIMLKSRKSETPIELIIPREGILTQYNHGKGGLHHIAFQVQNLKDIQEEYEVQSLEMLEPYAVKGNGNILINFLRPRFGEGILVEFVQEIPSTE